MNEEKHNLSKSSQLNPYASTFVSVLAMPTPIISPISKPNNEFIIDHTKLAFDCGINTSSVSSLNYPCSSQETYNNENQVYNISKTKSYERDEALIKNGLHSNDSDYFKNNAVLLEADNIKKIKGKSYQALRQNAQVKHLYTNNTKKNEKKVNKIKSLIDFDTDYQNFGSYDKKSTLSNISDKNGQTIKNNRNISIDEDIYRPIDNRYSSNRIQIKQRNANIKDENNSFSRDKITVSMEDEYYKPISRNKDNSFKSEKTFSSLHNKDIELNPKVILTKKNRVDDEEYYIKMDSLKSTEDDEGDKCLKIEIKKDKNNLILNKNGIIKFKKDNWLEENQRELLIEQLSFGSYECMVCYYAIKKDTAVWNCTNCFHVFHLYCIKKWAHSSIDETDSWRCPGCQNTLNTMPKQYYCYCGKQKDPVFNGHITPHSCGEVCAKERSKNCIHFCNILCHPGPCPPCLAYINQKCKCGKKSYSVKCHQASSTTCGEICGKLLNCGRHTCQTMCHNEACDMCQQSFHLTCYCARQEKTVPCGSKESFLPSYSCGELCDKMLSCGEHKCISNCHPGPCKPCSLSPSLVVTCPCGKMDLSKLTDHQRTSCLDPIPVCDLVCSKVLKCSQPESEHLCESKCHTGDCPPCLQSQKVECRCGREMTSLPCLEVAKLSTTAPYKCTTRCNKKMACGRHKCTEFCCDAPIHVCQLICARKLSCGLHKCDEPCHKGLCKGCWQVSFDELKCECGAQVIYPPVPCGTKPPECLRPCTRKHSCNHSVEHNCHNEPTCPNCTRLVERMCMGAHELRRNIPCYLEDVSCGRPCSKRLPCAMHLCVSVCHKGTCLDKEECKQACTNVREICGHPCAAACHPDRPCPNTICRAQVLMTCECGRKKEMVSCLQNNFGSIDFEKANAKMMANKLWESQSISIQRNSSLKKLACDSECAILERNRRLALALEIKNPDLSGKLGNPTYSQFLRDYAKSHSTFVADIEKTLTDLVNQTQQMKIGKKSHSFKVMALTQRKLLHQLTKFYGCEATTYDDEPNKNVVVTAIKDKCWLPNVTLTSMIQRELFPKAPTPIPINCKEDQLKSAAVAAKQSTQVFSSQQPTTSKNKHNNPTNYTRRIDYFDYESD